jgi:hypothetical protein
MPDPAAQLAHDLSRLRSGHGSDKRRRELRQRLAQVDPRLRDTRNRERLRLAQLRVQARTGDTRRHPSSELQRAIEQCTAKLAALDAEIVTAVAALGPGPRTDATAAAPSARRDHPAPAVVAEARSMLRNRLWLTSALLDGLPLAAEPVRRVQAAIGVALRKL